MDKITLRAHHGMCLQYFEGRGYSSEFTAHMGKVLNSLTDNTEIEIITEADIVCSRCPNLKNGICTDRDLVKRYDEEVLKAIKVSPESVLTWDRFRTLVKENILTTGKREAICRNCRWNSICREKEKNASCI